MRAWRRGPFPVGVMGESLTFAQQVSAFVEHVWTDTELTVRTAVLGCFGQRVGAASMRQADLFPQAAMYAAKTCLRCSMSLTWLRRQALARLTRQRCCRYTFSSPL